MKTKKHSFTLIEFVISLFLITILLGCLFGYFSKIIKIEKDIEKLKKNVYERNHLHVGLNTIFSQIGSNNLEESSIFTTYEKNDKNPTLNITFDAGVDPDPDFSGIIKAKIYIDKTNNLVLETISNNKIKAPRQTPILSNIQTINYKFLSSKDLNMQKYQQNKVTDSLFWYFFWPKEKKSTPRAICIKINNNLDFAFFLHS